MIPKEIPEAAAPSFSGSLDSGFGEDLKIEENNPIVRSYGIGIFCQERGKKSAKDLYYFRESTIPYMEIFCLWKHQSVDYEIPYLR